MAKVLEDITVEVQARLSVDRKTAEACLKMVELYVNANPVQIEVHRERNGEETYSFIPYSNEFTPDIDFDYAAEDD